jgi:hypothetical protein
VCDTVSANARNFSTSSKLAMRCDGPLARAQAERWNVRATRGRTDPLPDRSPRIGPLSRVRFVELAIDPRPNGALPIERQPALWTGSRWTQFVQQIGASNAHAATRQRQAPPEPIKPIGTAGGGNSADGYFDADGEFTGTPEQWASLRKSGKIK